MPLAYYARAATEAFWAEHWAGQDVTALVEVARASPLTAIIEHGLPATGRVLEAGCGLGPYVILLRERGHDVIGVDWSAAALGRGRLASPAPPLAAMDLTRLAIASGMLDGYLSLGVVEHDRAGPGTIVAEAARVLRPGGRLVLSVPYWNGVRRLLAPHLVRQARRRRARGEEFYQFAFTRGEVRAFLQPHGFRVLSFHPYDPARMLRAVARRLGAGPAARARPAPPRPAAERGGALRARPFRAALRRLLYSEVSLRCFAHMLLAVAVRR